MNRNSLIGLMILGLVSGCGDGSSAKKERNVLDLLDGRPQRDYVAKTDAELEIAVADLDKSEDLARVQVEGDVTDASFAKLSGKKAIQNLSIGKCSITDQGMRSISDLPNLEILSVFQESLSDAAFEKVAGWTKLSHVWLITPNVTNAGIAEFGKIKTLKVLNINGTNLDDETCRVVSDFPNLTDLTLFHRKASFITDAGLEKLGRLTNLTYLYLPDSKITGSGFVHLKGLTKLRELRLDGSPITDSSLASLQPLSSLQSIKLQGTKVTDKGLAQLHKAFPKAEIIDVAGATFVPGGPPPRVVEDLARFPADFVLEAPTLYSEVRGNEKAAIAKYDGKVLEVSGVVGYLRVSKDFATKAYIPVVVLENKKNSFDGIGCVTASDTPWETIATGQKLTVRGRWKANEHGFITDCVVVGGDPSPRIKVTAEAITKELAANSEVFEKKYRNKQFFVTGKLAKLEFNSFGVAEGELEGTENTRVLFSFNDVSHTTPLARSWQVGDTVGVAAKALGFYGGRLQLDDAFPVSMK